MPEQLETPHFLLDNQWLNPIAYHAPSHLFPSPILPARDWVEHANTLRNAYDQIFNRAEEVLDLRKEQGKPEAGGVYMNVDVTDRKLIPTNIDTKKGAHLLKVALNEQNEGAKLTLFVERKKKKWLHKQTDALTGSNPKRDANKSCAKLLLPIQNFQPADVCSLFEARYGFNEIDDAECAPYEVWVSKRTGDADIKACNALQSLEVVVLDHRTFPDVIVYLVRAMKHQLEELVLALGHVESIRPYQKPSVLLGTPSEIREWNDLLNQATKHRRINSDIRVGVLDTGVNNTHPLLADYLPDDCMDSAIGANDNLDHSEHGTDMAGLVVYGDLTELAYHRGEYEDIEHGLVSVKIMEKDTTIADVEDEDQFYAVVVEDAVDKAFQLGAPIQCMAITDAESLDGRATSSSAALDESIFNRGQCNRLVLVSAGNIQPDDVNNQNYIDSCQNFPILSPAQAWNALTVGAYTEKSVITDDRCGYLAIASPQGLSPLSRSSYMWHSPRVKPEIVMEGGNVAHSPVMGNSVLPDLSLVATSQNLRKPLEDFQGTSASTALAARMAARIKAAYPACSMLTVRALMVHAARWTPRMEEIANLDKRLALCGYGVPREEFAIRGSNCCATYIIENELVPYFRNLTSNIYNQLHLYTLPWPAQLLLEMGEERVTLRVTLSYYVEPAPGMSGQPKKNRYPSAMLNFDVKTFSETSDEFVARHQKHLKGEPTTPNDTARWKIKQKHRERSTVQTDSFACTAAQLANCNLLMVYPDSGWWKDSKLTEVYNRVKYSLVVSIETENPGVYQAVKQAIANAVPQSVTADLV